MIHLSGSVALPTVTVAVSGIMLGMALQSWIDHDGRRWARWAGHALARAARAGSRAAIAAAKRIGMQTGQRGERG